MIINSIDTEMVRKLYWDDALSILMVAHTLGISRSTIENFMRKNNIPIRTHKDAMALASKTGRIFRDKDRFIG